VLSSVRLEAYLRHAAGLGRETVEIQPFKLFFDPSDPLRFFNYARPVEPMAGDVELLRARLAGPLDALCTEFIARKRVPRFEFLEDFAPSLPQALRVTGFMEEGRFLLMFCDPSTVLPTPPVPHLGVQELTADSSNIDLRDFVKVEREGFGHASAADVADEDGEDVRESIRLGGLALLARLDGHPVGVGSCTSLHDGLTELAGIATLPAYRGLGIAAAITAAAAKAAFERGVETAFLTAGDAAAGRVYERVGFRPAGITLAYYDPSGLPAPAEPPREGHGTTHEPG
jgi:ribosomal protein S18 acetylase RimI-like enzyme